jgi:hypothetical protein
MNPETIDNTESGRLLKVEAINQAAIEIRRRHEKLEQEKYHAVNFVASALKEAVEIATLVEQVHATLGGARFAQWWRDQNLPEGWGRRYLTIANSKRDNGLIDKDQLRLLGILPDPQGHNEGTSRKGETSFAWIKWASKIPSALPVEKVKDMDEADRRATLKHLEPIERLIAALRSGLR